MREKELEVQNNGLKVENVSLREELKIVKKKEDELAKKWGKLEGSDLGKKCLELQERTDGKTREIKDLKEVILKQKKQSLMQKYEKKSKPGNKLSLESKIRSLKRLNGIKAQNVHSLHAALRVAKGETRKTPRAAKKIWKVVLCILLTK